MPQPSSIFSTNRVSTRVEIARSQFSPLIG
jgi:hypothetical protein